MLGVDNRGRLKVVFAFGRATVRSRIQRVVAVVLLGIVIDGCGGQLAQMSPTQTYASTEQNYLRGLEKGNEFSGAVAVAVGGRVILQSSVGYADWKTKTLIRPDTPFRIGSITKVFTATAVMLLVQDGKLRLDDEACSYVADCPRAWSDVTVRNLLTHTSGIPDYLAPITLSQFNAPTPPRALLALVADKPLNFPPGSGYGYSNTNYVLLGLIIESLSGLSYDAYLQQRIFGPLGMRGSGYERDFSRVPNAATGYGYKTLSRTEAIPTDEAAFSDGGLHSTIDDLLKFDRALTDHRLLTAALEDQMFTPWGGAADFPNDAHIGLGWLIKRDQFGATVVYHGGQIPGFNAAFERDLGSHVTAVVLSNFYWADSGQIASVLVNAAPKSVYGPS